MGDILDLDKLLEHWSKTFVDYLPRVFLAIIVVIVFSILGRIFRRYLQKIITKISRGRQDLAQILSSFVFLFFLITGIFIGLEILKLEGVLTKLIAGAGVMGIIAGFAFKDIASNAFAGLLVNFQRPFKIGDWVNLNGQFGTISKIGWISTSVKTVTGQEAYVPNQLIYNSVVTNYSTYGKRRVVMKSGVSYGDDLDHVRTVALDEVKNVDGILLEENIEFYFTEIGSSSYNFEIRFWIKYNQQVDFLNAQSDVIMKIKKRFEQEDISLAYSVLTLDFGVKGGVNLFDKEVNIAKQ